MNRLVTIRDSLHVQVLSMGKSAVPEQGFHTPISEGVIHVWSARYSTLDRYYPLLSVLVSPEEMRKAAGFKKPGDARRYILRHGMVRAVLGHYLHGDPEKIRFVQGMNGKPDLDPEAIFPDIRFSLSGTDERVCLGITRNSEIGLDIVRTQPRYSCPAVAHYLFTQTERRWIAQAVLDRRPMRFFRVWSLKEALLKASGNGARLMQDVDVAGIMTDTYLNGGYPLHIGKKEMLFFIHESGCGTGHHRVIATLL